MTPILLFSVFSAASMLAYLVAFPWMDPEISPRARSLYGTCIDYLTSVQNTWKMVANWVDTLTKLAEIHHKFAKDGRAAYQTTDHFADFRTRVLDFGSLTSTTQLDTSYPHSTREMYSSVRTGVSDERNGLGTVATQAAASSQQPLSSTSQQTRPSNAFQGQYANQFAPSDIQPMQSIHEGSLLAFMQGNNWDFLNDDWLGGFGPLDEGALQASMPGVFNSEAVQSSG